MKPDIEISGFDFLVESLGRICMPGMEAMKLRSNCDIRSLADIPRAAEGAGCEISYVDLPEKISGFAQVIDGQPYIVVNRAKPSKHTTHRILSVKALGDRILLTLALASSRSLWLH
jgi:hypothetical protein